MARKKYIRRRIVKLPSIHERFHAPKILDDINEILATEQKRYKYADNTPNNFEVQQVLYSITGNRNMYSCTNQAQIRQAFQRVMNKNFDIVGHKMYSAGLKKYLKFLEENGL